MASLARHTSATNGAPFGVVTGWILSLAILIAVSLSSSPTLAEEGDVPGRAVREPLSLLLVQTAEALRYQEGELRLVKLGPMSLFFADRPQPLEGFLPTDDFVAMWAESWNRYSADPPNAGLKILEPADLPMILIELQEARFEGEDLIYKVRLLEGELPAVAGAATLFIDSYIWVPPDRGPQALGWIRCHTLGRGVPHCYSDW